MTDAAYVFKKDIQDKKRIGYGARNKINGSKSKKCSLPSDHLTKKQKEALNGKMISYDFKKFYSWEEFKEMPSDIQVEYINSLINRYDVGLATISEYLFGRNKSALSMFFSRRGELQFVNSYRGRHSETARKAFIALFSEPQETTVTSSNVAEKPEDDIAEKKPIETSVSDFLICIDRFDDAMWSMAKNVFANTENLKITISVAKGS